MNKSLWRALKNTGRRFTGGLRNQRGFTIVELMITMLIIGILAVPLTMMISNSLRSSVQTTKNFKSQDEVRQAFEFLEKDIIEATQFTVAQDNQMVFLLDSYHLPTYRPLADSDSDGYSNLDDPDDDNDANQFEDSNALIHYHGDDLEDDDDDNNNKIDVQVWVHQVGQDLVEDINYNEAGWQRLHTLLKNVSTFQLTYFGSANEVSSNASLDRNGDGRVDQWEIDAVAGDNNGVLNTVGELLNIRTVRIRIGQDQNGDGKEDFGLTTELSPPLLPLKRS